MRKVIAVILASLLVVTPAFADRTMYAPVRLAPVATAGTILFADGTAAAPSMSFSADPDTGVFRPADNELGFSRGGSEALRITSTAIAAQTGYVIHSRPGSNSAPAFSFSTDNDTGMYLSGTNALSLATAGTERMRINANGEVHMGSNFLVGSQTASLSTVTTGARFAQISTDAGAGSELVLYSGAASDTAFNHITFGGIRTNIGATARISANRLGVITFGNNDAANGVNTVTERMRITSGGNVGIGTTSPARLLDVNGPSRFRDALYFSNDERGRLTWDSTKITLRGESGYAISLAAGGTERMRIDSSGQIQVGDGTAAAPVLSFSADTDTGVYRPGTNILAFSTNGVGKMTITPTGEVVVGQGHNGGSPVAGSIIGAAVAAGISNTAGVNLTIAGGNSTGTGAGGALIFQTAAAGSSGSAANTLTERMRVKPNGQVRYIPLAADPAGAEAGDVYYNSSTNKLKVYNGTSWVDLH